MFSVAVVRIILLSKNAIANLLIRAIYYRIKKGWFPMNTKENQILPKPILNKRDALNQLVQKYPDYLPLPVCASFLGMDDDGLRRAIECGQCTFGLAWKRPGAANRAFKIPTFTFVAWYTNGFNLLAN